MRSDEFVNNRLLTMEGAALKKIIKRTVAAMALLLTCSCAAFAAESVEEFEKSVVAYQRNPLARVAELKAAGYEAVAKEDMLVHQMKVPFAEVLAFESSAAKRMNHYLSVYYLEKQDSTADTSVIDQDTLNELMQQTPPYTLLYYTDLLDHVEKCRAMVAQREGYLKKYKERLAKCKKEKEEFESAYRVYNNKLMYGGTKNVLVDGWKLELIKAKLEECIIEAHFYEVATISRQNSIADVKAKQVILENLLEKIRYKITFSKDDFKYLDHWVQRNVTELLGTLDMLNKRYDELSEIRKNGDRPTAFTKFCYSTEQTLIENEILVLLNIAEGWTSLRAMWRMLEPLTQGKINNSVRQQYLKDQVDTFLAGTRADEEYCINELSKINAAELSANNLFGKDSIVLTPADLRLRDEFYASIAQHRNRMTEYIFTVVSMRNRCQDVKGEVDIILGNSKETNKQKIKAFIDKIKSMRDFELMHIEDYPITLGALLIAILILACGNFVALGCSYLITRRMKKLHVADGHTILLATTIVKYTIWIIAILIALSSLRIPFKAFAVAGGALAVALGFGAQTLMSDIFCGISLLIKNRIRVGDHITLNGNYGIVKEITLRDTVVLSEDSKDLVIPNRKFFSDEFVNLTLTSPVIRTTIGVGIAYNSDVSKAEKIILDILDHSVYVIREPYRRVLFNKFDDSALGLLIQFFMDVQKYSQFEVQSKVREEILEAFRKNDIEIAYPQLDVHFDRNM